MDKKVVIIPTYNEKENVEKIIRKVFSLDGDYEILIIDDGSPDGTASIVKTLAKEFGFRVMQFNAVVESNVHAQHLYERLGFVRLGTIPGCFRMKDGHYENIIPYYHSL